MSNEDYTFEIGLYEGILRRLPRDIEIIEILGGLYSKTGRVDEGLRMDRRLVRLLPESATAHYNLGCSLALKRRKAEAIRALRRAIELGYRDLDWMRDDPDLKPLQTHPAFAELLSLIENPGN